MSLARCFGISLVGLEGELVEVQCDISAGLPGLSFTGLPDASVLESRDRVRSAVQNSGASWPNRRITVALLPADVRKIGSRFDLALALAVLAGAETVPPGAVADVAWIAELGLDGRLRPVRGVLPSVLAARRLGIDRVVVAAPNAAEAALVPGVQVRAAHDLAEIIGWLTGEGAPVPPVSGEAGDADAGPSGPDLIDVAGQAAPKRALEIAAAGGHNLSMIGPPGAGKTMLAKRLPGLLPPLDDDAAMEVTAVQSVAGMLGERPRLVRRPPLQAPHHTSSVAALVGGGSHLARPGAISLAHHGVLFLDEAPEFSTTALDALRQPIEDGYVVLHRSGGAVRYPARFQLVLAANPCPCARPDDCTCPKVARRRYEQRLSGPLLDRIDLNLWVDPVPHGDLFELRSARPSSAAVAARVAAARDAAVARWAGQWRTNAEVPGSTLRAAPWLLPRHALRPVRPHLDRGTLTARGFDRMLRLAWTLADLAGRVVPDAENVSEAIFFRTGRANSWAA